MILTTSISAHPASIAECTDEYDSTICTNPNSPTFGETDTPEQWLDLCDRDPDMCEKTDLIVGAIPESNRITLEDANDKVNYTIKPISDQMQYNEKDYWTLPKTGWGDCEDYALLKRKVLIDGGWNEADLSIALVYADWFPKGEGHAVLLVHTSSGDMVLDNMRADILPWSETGYTYIKQQSGYDPNVWLSMTQTSSAH